MRDVRYIVNKLGRPQSGYTIKLYKYYKESPYYQGDPIVTYTDNSDGSYYADITQTVKGTLVITKPDGSTFIPTQFIGYKFTGDDAIDIPADEVAGEDITQQYTEEFYPE